MLCCTACSSDGSEKEPEEGEKTISFEVVNYQQVSLDDVTRATDATALAHLDMAIYDAATNALVSQTQTAKGDNNYGQFSATLAYGQYTVVFLGYNGDRTANMSNPTAIIFGTGYIPNMFYKTMQLTVSPSSNATEEIVLKRGVAAFKLKHSGYIPNTLTNITIIASGGGCQFNALTGYATETVENTLSHNMKSIVGGTSFTLYSFTFLPAETATMTFTAVAKDANNEVLQERVFSNVPMKINQRTIYTGQFFGSGTNVQGFSLSLETDQWDEVNQTY